MRLWSKAGIFLAGGIRLSAVFVCCLLIAGCTVVSDDDRLHLEVVEPLVVRGRALAVEAVPVQDAALDVLAIDDKMRAFISSFTDRKMGRRELLRSFHQAFNSPGLWPIHYDAAADGTAMQTFHAQRANCLSYAHLIVAIAREAGLDARYHWLEIRPKWTRMGEQVAVRLHVNALVRINRSEEFMVDIDPLQVWEVAGSRDLSDSDAKALHLNNMAMKALVDNELETVWNHLVSALRLSPGLAPLWVNLGVLYVKTGQMDAAERSYLEALRLDPGDRSAMTNLVALYARMGLEQQREQWQKRVERYQANNPFYHSHLGDLAFEQGDLVSAGKHYEKAVVLQPANGGLLYLAGLVHFELGDRIRAEHYFSEAVEHATLLRDRALFKQKLEEIRESSSMDSAVPH